MVLEEEGIYGGEYTQGFPLLLSPRGVGAGPQVLRGNKMCGCPPTDVSCDEWAFSLLPLDVDLLSMELPEFFRDYFLVTPRSRRADWAWVGCQHGHPTGPGRGVWRVNTTKGSLGFTQAPVPAFPGPCLPAWA